MKKLTLIISALALVLGMSQCKKPNQPIFGGGVPQTITFTTGNNDEDAKGDFDDPTALGAINYKWSDTDRIFVFASANGTFGEGNSQFVGALTLESCVANPDGSYTGTFKNTLTMPFTTGKVKFVHYGQDVTVDSNTGAASVSFDEQNGKLRVTEAEHLAGQTSVSSKVIASKTVDYSSDGNYNTNLIVEFAVVRLSFEKFTDKSSVTFSNIGKTGLAVDTYGNITGTGNNTSTLSNVNDSYYTIFMPVSTETEFTFTSMEEESSIVTSKVTAGLFYSEGATGNPIVLKVKTSYTDVVKGAFSIADDTKVYFAKGNVLYRASTNTWRFAEHQYDFVGCGGVGTVFEGGVRCSNRNIGKDYDGWIDMFGFGSTGNKHSDDVEGQVPCYMPYCVNGSNTFYKIYNSLKKNLYEEDKSADWGYNFPGSWFTMKKADWEYLIDRPDDKSCDFVYGGVAYDDCHFAKIKINYDGTNTISGILFFPDVFQWTSEMGDVPANINVKNSNYGTSYTLTQFEAIEGGGCLFMPAAGYRYDENGGPSLGMYALNMIGDYWTSDYVDNDNAYLFQVVHESYFSNVYVQTHYRRYGFTVRLATKVTDTNIDDGTATNLDVKPW